MTLDLRPGWLVVGSCLLAGGCAPAHTLSRHESILFQPASCYERPDGTWSVVLRGGIYKESWLNRIEPDLVDWLVSHHVVGDDAEKAILESRLALFLDDHVKDKVVEVVAGDAVVPLRSSDLSGRVLGSLTLTDHQVQTLAAKDGSGARWITLPVKAARGDQREFKCEALVLHQKGTSVVSDIDDTIKITNVNNTKLMLQNTFLLPFRPVPGMPELYAAWQKEQGAVFHYLSESPLELYRPLAEFLPAEGFPKGTVDLREIPWRRSRLKGILEVAEAPRDFKLTQLQALIDALPDRDYVLVGDSSQHDPEVYAATARKYPKQVKRILIHDVTCEGPDSPRYQRDFDGLPRELWQIFRDPSEIRDAIRPGTR